jgi:hypothetical protein
MFYFPSGQEGTPVPVWELHNTECKIKDQVPVVTVGNYLGDAPSPLFSFHHCDP